MAIKFSLCYQRWYLGLRKFLSILLVLSFTFVQAIPYGYADITLRPDDYASDYVPETAVDVSQDPSTPAPAPKPNTTTSFLSSNPMSFSADTEPAEQLSVPAAYDYEEYSFVDAVAQFSPDYASAVVVSSVTAEDLRQLTRLDVEVGLAVIRGKVVMFTTGSKNELRANPVVREILAGEASIFIHVHPEGEQTDPSALDIDLAGTAVEYLITTDRIFAYNVSGIKSSDMTDKDLLDLIDAVRVPEASSVEARAVLNKFIANIDEYNVAPQMYTIFRSAQPVSVLPGRPTLGVWNHGAPLPVVSQSSTSEFAFGYDISTPESYVGATINFNANGKTSQDLSGLGYFSFDIMSSVACSVTGDRRCAVVEFKDTSGRTAKFAIQKLETSYVNKSPTIAWIKAINTNLDMTRIKEINFIFENSWGAAKAATVSVKVGGLYFEPSITAPTTSALTDLNGAVLSELEPCS
ncbi:MAG TPA: hypothetical protein PLH16_03620, partial [Candidatus Omnitrophota bacterium]|nr:hypothetical protein [Candidatus Omnitrophota bacterium]